MPLAAVAWLMASALACPRLASADTIDAPAVEERLPEVRRPIDDPASATKPPSVQVDQDDLASIPEFVLRSARIEGISAIESGGAEECAAVLIGKTVGAADLVQLTECITDLYRARDFFLSRAIVPKQEVRDGALYVKVVEGYIAAVDPDGMSGEMRDPSSAQRSPNGPRASRRSSATSCCLPIATAIASRRRNCCPIRRIWRAIRSR